MSNKNSLQKQLLKLLGRKKLASTDELVLHALSMHEDNDNEPTDPEIKYRLNRTLKRLENQAYIEIHPTERSRFARLTKRGRQKLHSLELGDKQGLTPMRWDGLWRFVIMNIPEDRKDERDSIRYLLKKANFECLKNAVWVSPYPLEHLLDNLKRDFGFTDELMVIVSGQIDSATEQVLIRAFQHRDHKDD